MAFQVYTNICAEKATKSGKFRLKPKLSLINFTKVFFMKKFIWLCSVLISSVSLGQNNAQIDSRLLVNKEIGAKAMEYFSSDPEQYNFLLYELENAYFIRSMTEVTESQKTKLLSIAEVYSVNGEKFETALLNNPEGFNFHLYNFQRSETQTIGYDLGNGNVLVFYSVQKLREMYQQQSSNK